MDATGGKQGTLFLEWISALVKRQNGNILFNKLTIIVPDSSEYQVSVFDGKNNMVLISFPGFAKNQEDKISSFKISHWKQVVFK